MSLVDGADLLFTTLSFEQPAANVAEYYGIPLVTLHYFPARVTATSFRSCLRRMGARE